MSAANEKIIAESIDYLVAQSPHAPDLEALARRAGYETTHFQKLFKQKVGLSPKQLQHYMGMRRARDFLLAGYPTLQAAYESGLSGNARLHDVFVTIEGATPGEVKSRGKNLTIQYGYHPTILGEILVGASARGVCWLGFVVDEDRAVPFNRLREHWPLAALVQDAAATKPYADHIMAIWQGTPHPNPSRDSSLPPYKGGGLGWGDESRRGGEIPKLKLDLFGSNFQIQVWQALLKIPCGAAVSYQDVADYLGKPSASRAVGSAVGKNPISLLIPCHRVIQQSGIVENYGWGTPRKKFLLGLEVAACHPNGNTSL